jgi:hypothetical protein
MKKTLLFFALALFGWQAAGAQSDFPQILGTAWVGTTAYGTHRIEFVGYSSAIHTCTSKESGEKAFFPGEFTFDGKNITINYAEHFYVDMQKVPADEKQGRMTLNGNTLTDGYMSLSRAYNTQLADTKWHRIVRSGDKEAEEGFMFREGNILDYYFWQGETPEPTTFLYTFDGRDGVILMGGGEYAFFSVDGNSLLFGRDTYTRTSKFKHILTDDEILDALDWL